MYAICTKMHPRISDARLGNSPDLFCHILHVRKKVIMTRAVLYRVCGTFNFTGCFAVATEEFISAVNLIKVLV